MTIITTYMCNSMATTASSKITFRHCQMNINNRIPMATIVIAKINSVAGYYSSYYGSVSISPNYSNFSSSSSSSSYNKNDKEVIVVRHGETDWNRQLLVQGRTDIELNENGQLQASITSVCILKDLIQNVYSTKKASSKTKISIYSSKLLRASHTANEISKKLPLDIPTKKGDGSSYLVPVMKSPSLNEWDLGCLEGLSKKEASIKCKKDWNIFTQWCNPHVSQEMSTQNITNGESMEDVRIRAVTFIEGLITSSSSSSSVSTNNDDGKDDDDDDVEKEIVIVVTHGGVLGQLLRHVVVAQYDHDDADANADDSSSLSFSTSTTATAIASENDDNTNSNADNDNNNDNDKKKKYKYHKPSNACITKFSINSITKKWTIDNWANIDHLKGTTAEPIGTNYNK